MTASTSGIEDLAANVDRTMLRNFDPEAKDVNDPTPTRQRRFAWHRGGRHHRRGGQQWRRRSRRRPRGCAGQHQLPVLECMSTGNTIQAYGGAPYSADAWVINASYGQNPTAPIPVDIDTDAKMRAIRGFANMRDGKGIVMVKSAGNEFLRIGPEEGGIEEDQCGPARQHGLSCENRRVRCRIRDAASGHGRRRQCARRQIQLFQRRRQHAGVGTGRRKRQGRAEKSV